MLMLDDHCSMRAIAECLCRSASTISREIKRADAAGVSDANGAKGMHWRSALSRAKCPSYIFTA
jgi:IS30 family transposase